MKAVIAIAVLALSLASCKTDEQALKESGHTPLSSAQVSTLFTGNTRIGTSSQGFKFVIYSRPNGTAHYKSSKADITGKWRVDPTKGYCSAWPKVNDGQEACHTVYKVGDHYQMFKSDGSGGSTFTIEKGNTQNL